MVIVGIHGDSAAYYPMAHCLPAHLWVEKGQRYPDFSQHLVLVSTYLLRVSAFDVLPRPSNGLHKPTCHPSLSKAPCQDFHVAISQMFWLERLSGVFNADISVLSR